jgi:hypothetical protein
VVVNWRLLAVVDSSTSEWEETKSFGLSAWLLTVILRMGSHDEIQMREKNSAAVTDV